MSTPAILLLCLLIYAQFSRRQIVVYVRNCQQERGTLTRRCYALPVSCIPYAGLTETKARQHINWVVSEMTKRYMKISGKFVFHNVFILYN